MNGPVEAGGAVDVGEYCRQVEAHLTKVNGGHLVRIVGPGFELVRGWAIDGIPLRVVLGAIDQKAARHALGSSDRPLRIEFCEGDVRAIFDRWRRAVGVWSGEEPATSETPAVADAAPDDRRQPSLAKHLQRAIDRLTRAGSVVDAPEPLRNAIDSTLAEIVEMREASKHARGPARDAFVARLAPLDTALLAAARGVAAPDVISALEREAADELAPYRVRLDGAAWSHAMQVTVDRLLREHFLLPTLEL
ncbi:MAG TPA: hypothetical protein VFO19_23210 [Vicinamibacterales bacterium]|nr:hypothetical protein [Vicinamibacterales bacterium]